MSVNVDVDEVTVKAEPVSPVSYEEEHETIDINNNCEDTTSTKQKRKFSDTTESEPIKDEYSPKTPKQRSPISKPAIDVSNGYIEVLQRIFPYQSRAILELIMRSSENDIVKAIESLVPDTKNYPPYPSVVSVRSFGTPFTPYPRSQEDEGRRSAFSPITKNGLYIGNSHKNNVHSLSAFQPVHPYSRTDVNPAPIPEHFKLPIHAPPYGYNRHASAALLSLSNAKHMPVTSEQGGMFCNHCGFGINGGDKFCSECGKLLFSPQTQ
jgi:hypothetical protein